MVAFALTGGAVAVAQNGGGAGDAAAVAKLAEDDTLEEPSKIPLEEKKARVETMVADIRAAQTRATEIMAEANSTKNVVQLNCIQEKLMQIKGLVNVANSASTHMLDGIAAGDDDVVNHEFTKVALAHQKAQTLRAEADQCVGEKAIYTGNTEIEMEVDPNLPQSDPTDIPLDGVYPADPEVASKS